VIDLLSSAPHYRAHLLPLWDALPAEIRGQRFDRDGPSDRVHWSVVDTSRAVLVASHRDLKQARRSGYRRIALAEHGIGQSYSNGHPAYPGGRDRDAVTLFLSPNETAAGMDRVAYPGARVEAIGDPVLDTLPRGVCDLWTGSAADVSDAIERDLYGTDDDPVVAISFHWDCRVAPETHSAFPHYRAAIADLARSVRLIGHAHPRAAGEMARFYRRIGVEFVPSFDEVCRRASVFVADNTSCLFEFASTGRPVVVLNQPAYRRDVELGLRFWAASGIGRNVDKPGELVEAVQWSLSMPRPSTVDAALRLAYSSLTGAAERGAAILAEWLQTSVG
jgi:hypothetical protein